MQIIFVSSDNTYSLLQSFQISSTVIWLVMIDEGEYAENGRKAVELRKKGDNPPHEKQEWKVGRVRLLHPMIN